MVRLREIEEDNKDQEFIEIEVEKRRIKVPVVELLESLLRRYIEDIEEDITTQEFYRSGYFLRRIPEERIRYYIRRQISKVVTIVATLAITTIVSLHAIIAGIDANFPPTIAAGAMLFTLTLYWLWKTSKVLI
ncbi:MAG: hypothetical protein ACTSYM_11700 [Candidatus Baldrarchaeia archaeon]